MGLFKDGAVIAIDLAMWAVVVTIAVFGVKGCIASCDKATSKRWYWCPLLRCFVPLLMIGAVVLGSSAAVRLLFPLEEIVAKW
jgi:predicted DNA repair protein MutK